MSTLKSQIFLLYKEMTHIALLLIGVYIVAKSKLLDNMLLITFQTKSICRKRLHVLIYDDCVKYLL